MIDTAWSVKSKFTCDHRQWAIYYRKDLHPSAASQTYSSYSPPSSRRWGTAQTNLSASDHQTSLFLQITTSPISAALIKAKRHIRKFRIKRKSPRAASNLVLLRKIPKGQDQKLKTKLDQKQLQGKKIKSKIAKQTRTFLFQRKNTSENWGDGGKNEQETESIARGTAVESCRPWSPNRETTNFSTRFCKIRGKRERPKSPKIQVRNQENKNSSYSASLGTEAYLEAWKSGTEERVNKEPRW
jgi:hypothetical protein